jgi:carbon-monoxide dehydrogenase medium subunit
VRYATIESSPVVSERLPLLQHIVQYIGDRQVRNRGTIGGSLCWNYVAACTPVAALATGATLVLSSRDNAGGVETRSVEIDAFLLGPMQTAREPGELLRAILLTGRRNGRAAPIGNGACPRPHFPSSALASG